MFFSSIYKKGNWWLKLNTNLINLIFLFLFMTAKQRRIFKCESKRVLNNQCVFKKNCLIMQDLNLGMLNWLLRTMHLECPSTLKTCMFMTVFSWRHDDVMTAPFTVFFFVPPIFESVSLIYWYEIFKATKKNQW